MQSLNPKCQTKESLVYSTSGNIAIYVNDLPNSSEIGCIHMFADGTTIYYVGKEVKEIIDALNHVLNDFRVWCCKNHLTVHTGKTVAMLISNHTFVGPLRPLINWTGNPKLKLCTLSLEEG